MLAFGLLIFLGYLFVFPQEASRDSEIGYPEPKKEILRVGLLADSHNENDLLARALSEAKNRGVNFVIGLGDYTNLGTTSELTAAKKVFDESGLRYFVTAGDRDGWASREMDSSSNFEEIFGESSRIIEKNQVQFVLLDNSDIYRGIDSESWELLTNALSDSVGQDGQTAENVKCQMSNVKCALPRLRFVFAHKTPYHPDSKHIMGEDSPDVARQAKELLKLLEGKKVDGFFSGDMHFFAEFHSPQQSVRITTVGAVARERNFQGPRFGILKIYEDYSWQVEDIPID